MIPKQLHHCERFIKLEPESKAPEFSPDGPFFEADDTELQEWIENGGNVGLNLSGPLVALDIDSDEFKQLANNHLLPTFSVRTGSGGEHWYYFCEYGENRKYSDGERDIGSVRSENWFTVVPPSIHDETGEEYHVLRDREIQRLPVAQIESFVEAVDEEYRQHSGGGGGGSPPGGGCVGGIPSIPGEYPSEDVTWNTARQWLSANGMLESLNRVASSDWSGLEFKLAKCLAEGGFSETSISDVLDRLSHKSKWHNRGSDYRTRTVRNAIVAACEDEYVEFSDPDDATEGRAVVEGTTDHTSRKMSGNDSTFTSKVQVVEHNSDGDAVQARLMEGTDGDTGETFEYVDVATGKIQETETVDGDTVEVPNIDDGPGQTSSLGSPESLELKIEALQQLKEELE